MEHALQHCPPPEPPRSANCRESGLTTRAVGSHFELALVARICFHSKVLHVRATYILLTIAYLVLFTALIPLLGEPQFTFSWFIAFAIALLIAAPLTHYEWRRSRRSMAMFSIVLLVIPLVSAAGVVVLFDDESRLPALLVVLSLFALLAFLITVLWREFRFEDRIPNHLLGRFLEEDNHEDDGVQWVVECTGNDAATPLVAVLHLQNNIDAERTVTLAFRPETPFAGGRRSIRFAALDPVVLPAAAEATVHVPFVAAETRPRKKIDVYVCVSAKGPAGPRNRRQRVGPGPRPYSRWLVFFALFAGKFLFSRGGLRIPLRSSGAASTDIELPPMRVELTRLPEEAAPFGSAVEFRS